MCLGINGNAGQFFSDGTGQGSNAQYSLFLRRTARSRHASSLRIRGKNIDDVTAHSIGTAPKVDVIARVLKISQLPQNVPLIDDLTT